MLLMTTTQAIIEEKVGQMERLESRIRNTRKQHERELLAAKWKKLQAEVDSL